MSVLFAEPLLILYVPGVKKLRIVALLARELIGPHTRLFVKNQQYQYQDQQKAVSEKHQNAGQLLNVGKHVTRRPEALPDPPYASEASLRPRK